MREILRAMASFPPELPEFDPGTAPDAPVPLFLRWLDDAVAGGILGPQSMTLATADAAGRVSSRVLICRDVDDEGRWYFASDAASGKGRDLAANPRAAASFYWPAQGRQIRISGPAAPAGTAASAADFRARPPGSRAAGLAGHQSQPLGSAAELDAAFRQAQAAVEADPDLVAPGWTLYGLTAQTVEFWQADPQRRHIRLEYVRDGGKWRRQLLWP
jgi:pyridoxamine 5'-phosphate oxidase